jgi:hypothetical protein
MTTHPSKSQTVAIVRKAFSAAPDIQSGFARVIQDTLYDECLAAERSHRKCKPVSCEVPSWSAQDAARYFAVKYLREYVLSARKLPTVSEYLHIRHECFTAASIAENYRIELTQWARGIPAEFDAIDYARMSQWNWHACAPQSNQTLRRPVSSFDDSDAPSAYDLSTRRPHG